MARYEMTADEVETAVDLLAQGFARDKVAKLIGVPINTLKAHVDPDSRKIKKAPIVHTEASDSKIRALHQKNFTTGQIAAKIGLPAASVHWRLVRMGLVELVAPSEAEALTKGLERFAKALKGYRFEDDPRAYRSSGRIVYMPHNTADYHSETGSSIGGLS